MKNKVLVKSCYILCLAFIAFPFISLFTRGISLTALSSEMVLSALSISLKSTLISLVIILLIGTPAGYACARLKFKGKDILDTIFTLPLVLPPAVAGLLLLITFGKKGWLGGVLALAGIKIPFTIVAVIMAQLFVALPMYIRTVSEGFKKVDTRLEQTAMTLGEHPVKVFFKITMPLAKGSIISGAIMAWARALAEFGATIMFAGNLMGKTQTLPLAIYSAMETDMDSALTLARIMVIISLLLLLCTHMVRKRDSHV